MEKINLVSEQVNLSLEREENENNYATNRKMKSKKVPYRVYTLRFRYNLKEKLDNSHETQFQMHNQRDDTSCNASEVIEDHADKIIEKMEEDPNLMGNNMESEKLRKNILKHMPQSLTLKRTIKKKIATSVNTQKMGQPISYSKRLQYRLSMKYYQMKTKFQDLISSYELWYSSMKAIEGQFGSATSSYFRFLRWLFIINSFVMAVTILFIVLPQLTFESGSNEHNEQRFQIQDIFTGEGFLTDTLLYYGFYSNQTVNIHGVSYNMPYAFFYTMLFLYVFTFLVLSYSVAESYRKGFIETEGLNNIFAHKIFCGWDFGIATKEAANLKSRAISNELKEYLSEVQVHYEEEDFIEWLEKKLIHLIINFLILIVYASIAFFLWFILKKHAEHNVGPVVIALAANIFNVVLPMLFTKISKYENYKNEKNAVGITLIRSFVLSSVIISTLVIFWLINSFSQECWETSLGQEMYRLIFYDFLFSLLIHASNLFHHILHRLRFLKIPPTEEFDVASNTLDLIYTQSLFCMGFFFSPLMSVIVTIKMLLTWYLKKNYLLKLCKPSSKSWRASQTQTWFLTLTFFTHLAAGGTILFILLKIPATNCGPFQGHEFIYDVILIPFDGASFMPLRFIGYLMKPGVVSLIIIALCSRVYYVREKAKAHRNMVYMLRNMLAWQSKDKKFLLQSIANITNGDYQHRADGGYNDPFTTLPRIDRFEDSTSLENSPDQLIASSSKFGC